MAFSCNLFADDRHEADLSGGPGNAQFDAQTGGRQHIDKRIKTKQVDLATHEVRHARLRHAKQARGFRLSPALGLDVLFQLIARFTPC